MCYHFQFIPVFDNDETTRSKNEITTVNSANRIDRGPTFHQGDGHEHRRSHHPPVGPL